MSASCEDVTAPFGPPDVVWEKRSTGELPEGAIVCGINGGQPVYAGRIRYKNELLIGTILLHKECCVFTGDGSVHEVTDHEIMAVPVGEPLVWEKVKTGMPLPKNLLIAGKSKGGEILYIGRVIVGEDTFVGWVDQEQQCLHVAVNDTEKVYTDFEILVHRFLEFLCICPPCIPPYSKVSPS